MLNRYIIIDDFYDNPDELVQIALKSMNEADSPSGNYAGVMTKESYFGKQHGEMFKQITQESSINPSTNANGRLRFTRENDSFKMHIHFDVENTTRWAGVVYLSKDHPNTDGTCFWKHLKTGLEAAPNTVEGFAKHGWSSFKDFRDFLAVEGIDESLWEKTFTVPYKYNRLVLFRPWLLHSPGPSFGDSLESSRIVQTLFLGN